MIEPVKRVLIVDDSSTMRAMLDIALEGKPGLKVVGLARDAEEALGLVKTTRPHIVLIDLCMPYIDGSALLAMLENHGPLCKIVLSTKVNLSEPIRRKLMELGAAAIFEKKDVVGQPEAFLAALHQAADRHRAARIAASASAVADSNVVYAADRFPMPRDEDARLRAVQRLDILNLDVDARLDILVRHLARLVDYPMAGVNVIGSDQLWIKASVGVAPQTMHRGETVCGHAICAEGITAIGDLRADPVLRALPMVTGAPRLRAYIGAPILAEDGARLGMVCVVDTRPRHPTRAEMDIVADMAALVATVLQTPALRLRNAA